MLTPSCWNWRRTQPVDGCEDATEQSAVYGHFGKLERDGTGMADDPCADFDEPRLQTGERPIRHLLGKVCALQEDAEIVGQRVKLKADLVLRHALAGQPRPVDRLLTFFDVLLGGATLIVEMDDPVRVHRQVGDDETDAGEQLAGMPLYLGDDPSWFIPGRRLILEVTV